MSENPGAYSEARDRIREKKDKEVMIIESRKEEFEKTKEKMRKKKGLDVHGLRQKIETGHSLESLKSDIRAALNEGTITRDAYDQMIISIDRGDTGGESDISIIDPNKLPFSQNKFAKYLENQPLGDNIGSDIVGLLYGLIVQGSAILIIIAWKILVDLVLLPRDIYKEIQAISHKP